MRSIHPLFRVGLTGLFATLIVLFSAASACATNSDIEAALRSAPDLSQFYQALQISGVLSELREDLSYTVFAPTNDAFARITRERYPCFYSGACRSQMAGILRDYILTGRHDLSDLASYGSGIDAASGRDLHVVESFVKDYAVEQQPITGKVEAGGDIVFKIGGLISAPEQLAVLQEKPPTLAGTSPSGAAGGEVMTERTVITKSTTTTLPIPIPDGTSSNVGAVPAETTSVVRSYNVP